MFVIATLLERIGRVGIVPVIQINDPDTAVPLARALDAGGIPVAEITFRTEHAPLAIQQIASEVPEVLVGAGTVLTTQQVDAAVNAGARFIVTPGFNPKVVDYCLEQNIPVIPGAPSTSDIEQAIQRGLNTVKIFPAEALGGLTYIKAISDPYSEVRFLPTGGINLNNINQYLADSRIIACGGSWMIDQALVNTGDYESITRMCTQAVDTILQLELDHIGLNLQDADAAQSAASALTALLHASVKDTGTVFYIGEQIEIMKQPGRGLHGHLAIACNNLGRTVFHLERRGIRFDYTSEGTDSTEHRYIFLQNEIAGFAIHLSQRQGGSS